MDNDKKMFLYHIMAKNTITKQTDSFLYVLVGFLLISVVYLLTKSEIKINTQKDIISSMQTANNNNNNNNNNSLNNILNHQDPLRAPLKDIYPIRLRNKEYSQMGILTRATTDKHPIILPLMGRTVDRGDKVQYYTISNSGSNNTRLPIKKNGKYCTNERGCDELYSGDKVYVEGYQESFDVTVYDNKPFEYII